MFSVWSTSFGAWWSSLLFILWGVKESNPITRRKIMRTVVEELAFKNNENGLGWWTTFGSQLDQLAYNNGCTRKSNFYWHTMIHLSTANIHLLLLIGKKSNFSPFIIPVDPWTLDTLNYLPTNIHPLFCLSITWGVKFGS